MITKTPSILNFALTVLTLGAFYASTVLIGVGLYNPYGKVDYFFGNSTWSADSNQVQFQANFPFTFFYVLDVLNRKIEQITSLSNWTNEGSRTNPISSDRTHCPGLFHIEEQFGPIEQLKRSPDDNLVAVVTSSSTPVWPITLYSETIIIYDCVSSEVVYTVDRSNLLRMSEVTSIFFTTSGSVYEAVFYITCVSLAVLLMFNLKRVRLRRFVVVLAVLLVGYGSCAFFSYLGWAST